MYYVIFIHIVFIMSKYCFIHYSIHYVPCEHVLGPLRTLCALCTVYTLYITVYTHMCGIVMFYIMMCIHTCKTLWYDTCVASDCFTLCKIWHYVHIINMTLCIHIIHDIMYISYMTWHYDIYMMAYVYDIYIMSCHIS